jgi:hypothetical protein
MIDTNKKSPNLEQHPKSRTTFGVLLKMNGYYCPEIIPNSAF